MQAEVLWGSAPRRTVSEVVAEAARVFPDKAALLFGDDSVTYRELHARSNAYGNALLELGVAKGDCVSVFMENCLEMTYAWLGIGKIGALEVGVNTAYRGEYLRHPIALTRSSVIIADAGLAPRVLELISELPDLRHLVVRGELDPGLITQQASRVMVTDLREFLDADSGSVQIAEPPTYADPCAVQFTGGTTGRSKGAVMSHNMQVIVAQGFADAAKMTSVDVVYSPLPMFHFSIKTATLLSSFLVGGTAVIDTRFSVSRTWDQVRRYNATGVNILGSMMLMLWNLPPEPRDKALPVRFIVGVPIPKHLHHKMEERYGCRFVSVYGMSETGSQTLSGIDQPGVPGASGKPVAHYQIKLFDQEEREVPVGKVGEVVCRPLQPHVMFEGYFADPEASAVAQKNLWMHTGDLGRFDENGNLYFVDRLKDSIRRRGENISSVEVELTVLKHPAVVEVVAHAVPSEFTEDEVKLCVILDRDKKLSVEELMDYCVKNLPFFAVPRYIEFLDDLPRTPVGRPQKNVLRERGVTSQTWDREAVGYKVPK
jgi:carnitine-CoA ligase